MEMCLLPAVVKDDVGGNGNGNDGIEASGK